MNKAEILKQLNGCLYVMDKRVTEANVNSEIEEFSSMIKTNYTVEKEFNNEIEKIKKISDYNVRKKMLKDLFRKYVR